MAGKGAIGVDVVGATGNRDPTRGESDPNRCWTLTNMMEAVPDVMSPMCWSLWTPLCELASRRACYDLGLLPKRMIHQPIEPNHLMIAPFYGRQAINVDRLATVMGALPGTSRQQVERDMLGTARTNVPDDEAPRARLPFIAARTPVIMARQRSQVTKLFGTHLAWWQRDVLEGRERSGRVLLAAARDRFQSATLLHARARFLSQALQGAITRLCESAGCAQSVTAVCAAFGDVIETSIAKDLWSMSRDEMTQSEFLRLHGFHGSNEGNVTGLPWRLDPEPLRAMATAMAQRPEGDRPQLREKAAVERRRLAEEQLRGALARRQRPMFGALVRLAANQVRCQEMTKAAFLMAIDTAREATRILGAELWEDGRLARPDDAVFLTMSELLSDLPEDSVELATFRRARRDEYRLLSLPTNFIGMPEPIEASLPTMTIDTLTGAPGSAGVAEGTARVIVSLDNAGELGPGEILVCRYTDPAWAAAMPLASGLVIDVGAPSSHGAIVARELGIPCVIGTATGTLQISTGDKVRVDGTRGEVTILAHGEPCP